MVVQQLSMAAAICELYAVGTPICLVVGMQHASTAAKAADQFEFVYTHRTFTCNHGYALQANGAGEV